MVQPLWRTVWRLLKKLKIELPYDLVILLLDIWSRESHKLQRYMHPMFTAALFTVAKTWRQLTRPSQRNE